MIFHLRNLVFRFSRARDGNTAVEFALIVPVILLLIVGIYEFGRLYWIQNTIQYAAEQTSRCVMARTDGSTLTDISSTGTCPYTNNIGGLNSSALIVDTNSLVSPCTGGLSASKCQLIRLKYNFAFDNLLGGLMGLVSHQSTTLPTVWLWGQSQVPIG